MRVYCFRTLAELAPYANDWQRLAAGVPFRGWTWLSHWWHHYGAPDDTDTARTRLATLCVFDDTDTLVGIAPWYLEESAMWGRVLRWLGSGEVCTDYLSVLCQPGREEAIIAVLAEYLVENAASDHPDALRWDLLDLESVDAEDRTMAILADCLAGSGCKVHRRPGLSCWRLELPPDWETYLASLGRNLRRDLRRLGRQWLETGRAALHVATRLDQLPQAMDILVELHQRRHQALGERGCFASPRFLGFYREVVPELLRGGQVQFCWLELEGRPVAAEYLLLGNGNAYAYQAGVEPDAIQDEPGKLLNTMLLRQAIAGGYRSFDFLRGDEPYKARFGARQRPMAAIRIVPPRTVAQFRHNLWLAGNNVKQWIKKGTGGQGLASGPLVVPPSSVSYSPASDA